LMIREKTVALFLCALLAVPFVLPIFSCAQQAAPPEKTPETQTPPQSEKIFGAPQNIKEASRIYVFLGWMWASIAVLIYFFRLKIKEADRLCEIKFFAPDKKEFLKQRPLPPRE
jgi:hypothetical protein